MYVDGEGAGYLPLEEFSEIIWSHPSFSKIMFANNNSDAEVLKAKGVYVCVCVCVCVCVWWKYTLKDMLAYQISWISHFHCYFVAMLANDMLCYAEGVIELLVAVLELCPSLCSAVHVETVLGAYHASTTKAGRLHSSRTLG